MSSNLEELKMEMTRLEEMQKNLNKMDRLSINEACSLWYHLMQMKKEQAKIQKNQMNNKL